MSVKLPTNPVSDGVTGSSEPTTTTNLDTTTFHEDENVLIKEFPRYISIGNSFKDTALGAREHEIKDFLRRPILCASGIYSTTSVVGSQLQTIPLPSACLSNASYSDKLRGFYGFRAKMICRVQVNSQRFQQGRLLLHYLPQTATMSAARLSCALSNLVLITQQPRVDFDIGADTEVMLEIPYVSNSMFYNLTDGSFDFGTFYLTVYSALATGGGSTTCTYSVWCHFEDVEVQYPTVSQSGIKVLRARGKGAASLDVSDQELQSQGLGPISGILSKASKSASILSEIPLISSFTAPASWMMGVMGRAADAIGFSKPTNAGPSEKRQLTTFAYMNNTNAIDNSIKIAVRSDNSVSQLPGFAGTDIDEMSIAYLVSIPSWFSTSTWTTNQTQGTSVLVFNLAPLNGYTQSVTNAGTTYQYGSYPVYGYIANHFKLWRGSITLTLKIVRTEFHSGRLLVAFFPGKDLGISNPKITFANTQYVYREIIDLRTSSEVSITFPWTSLTPYLDVGNSYGVVQVYVLNPLVAPATISTSCDVICEVSGAPDFEFAAPKAGNIAPAIFTPQSGISATSKRIESVMDNSNINVGLEPAMYCVGERIQSIRQLIKRFTSWYVQTSTSTNLRLTVSPSIHYLPQVSTSNGVYTIPNMKVDMLSYYAPLFRFQRGSTRVKVIDHALMAANFTTDLFYNIGASGYSNPPVTSTFTPVSTALCCDHPTVVVPSLSGGGEYEIPYYSMTHSSHVVVASSLAALPAREAVDNQPALTVTQASAGYSGGTRIYRSAGDDFSFGFFIGTVPLAYLPLF
jgi:hypothetical protein